MNGVKCYIRQGVTYVHDCDKVFDKFKPLTFKIENQTYQMSPQSFVQYFET
jgi:hypothetical protein